MGLFSLIFLDGNTVPALDGLDDFVPCIPMGQYDSFLPVSYTHLDVYKRQMHHDVDTIERMEIIRDLRLGKFDVLVGINLLREGLDIPEVSLVAILLSLIHI